MSTTATTSSEGGINTSAGNFLTTHELLKFQILEQPMPPISNSGAPAAPARLASGAPTAAGGVGSTASSEAAPDRAAVVHRAFAMLASRCMDPDPCKRPTFEEVVKKVEVMRGALVNANMTVHSQ
jgi:hypothetical protein